MASQSQPQDDRRQLKAVLDRFNTTGCVLTTVHEGRLAGCYVGFVTGCSLEPPRLLVCTSHANLTHELLERSGVLAIHVVGRGQEAWVTHFGMQSGRDVDKFASVPWGPGVTGSPILDDAVGYLEGRVIATLDCGDHTARVVEPLVAVLRDPNAAPLTQFEVMTHGIDEPHVPSAFPWSEVSRPG